MSSADPPAYTLSAPLPPAGRRSILDTRALILSNASILRPRKRDDIIELVVAKSYPAVPAPRKASVSLRTFTTPNSNVMISVPEASPSSSSVEAGPSDSTTAARRVEHAASLVMRSVSERDVSVFLKGQPRPTIEEALEWLLDCTEEMMADLLERHSGQQVSTNCCTGCFASLKTHGAK